MIKALFRIPYVIFVLLRHGIDGEISPAALPIYLRPLAYLCPGRYLFKRKSRGLRVRRALEQLGPVFIKFGQLLSTRPDLCPADIFDELSLLQDQVQPFASEQAQAIIEHELKADPSRIFKQLDPTPLASASIAQVHAARLKTGESVVIKVLRPHIKRIIKRDLACLKLIATCVHYLHPDGRLLQPQRVVDEYEYVILNELNLQSEAANAQLLGEHFNHSQDMYVPTIHWDYSSENILCMERISGIPVGDIAALQAANIDFKRLAERAVRIFFTQLLDNNFFHADMHPGNIFVDTSQPSNPKFIAIDCAIMGSLTDTEKLTLALLLNAIFKREYNTAAQLFVRSGWVDAGH